MNSKTLTFALVAIAMFGVLALATPAHAASTLTDTIRDHTVNGLTPVIFEDDDFGLVIDNDSSGSLSVGDYIVGIIQLPRVLDGDGSLPPYSVKTVSATGVATSLPGDGTELTGVFGLEVGSTYSSGGSTVYGLKPVAGGSVTFPAGYYGVAATTYTFLGTAGTTMLDLFEGTNGVNFSDALGGAVKPVTTASDGTYLGSAGITGTPAAASAGANAIGEFWVVIDTDADGVPDKFYINLNFIDTPLSSPFYRTGLNDLGAGGSPLNPGTTGNYGAGAGIYGVGTFSSKIGWNFKSDGDFSVLFVPTPTAGLAGVAMLAALAFGTYRRRKQNG
jgi:hypothetical protein